MKKLLSLILAVFFLFQFSLTSFANEEEVKEDLYSSLFEDLSDEVKQTLEEFGIDNFDYENILSLSPNNLLSFFYNLAIGKIHGPLKSFLEVSCIIMIICACYAYFPDDEKKKSMISLIGCLIVAIVVAPSIFPLINAAKSVIDMSSKFMMTLIPVLVGLIATCKNPVLAVSFESVAVYLSNIISAFCNKALTQFLNIFFSFCCVGCLSSELNVSSLSRFIKNTVTKLLSVLSAFFISFLSLKGIFASAVDTVATKGAKILISTAVPVIGSSLSEAYFALSGSLGLLKNCVGIVGIIVIAIINIPIITELLLWNFMFSACCALAKMMNINSVSDFLSSLCFMLKTLNIIIVFSSMLFIISTGITISMRSNI